MKIIVNFSRIIVGILFIISGLIKANDPLGFSYKLEEYFEVFAMDWMVPASLILSIFICITEVILGVAVLLGNKMKFSATLLLLMIIFFTWLTGYSAVTGKVTDCGCFGDALKLTPIQSFYKDLVLLIMIFAIFIKRSSIQPLLSGKLSNGLLAGVLILITSFTLWCYWYLPVIDFRPYKIGNNWIEKMNDGIPDVVETTLVYLNKKSDEEKEFKMNEIGSIMSNPDWEYKDTKNKILKKGKLTSIHDFKISDEDGNDISDDILKNPDYTFMVIMYDIDKTEKKCFPKINELVKIADEQKIKFIGLTSSGYEKTDKFRHELNSAFPFYTCDATALKTIIRSNPGLLLMKDGTTVGMWHCNWIPTFDEVKQKYMK